MKRFRVAVARLLLKGTGVILVRKSEVEEMHKISGELLEYAQHSGALNDPHRLKAQRRIGRLTGSLSVLSDRLEAKA